MNLGFDSIPATFYGPDEGRYQNVVELRSKFSFFLILDGIVINNRRKTIKIIATTTIMRCESLGSVT